LATQTLNVPDREQEELPEQLYRHSQRPEWGMALLAWEKSGRRAYQFEDGKLRKIQEGYYDLLDPVEDSDGPIDAVRANLQAAIKALKSGGEQKVRKAVCTFEQQVTLFTKLYPKGFDDPKWIEDKRGDASDGASALKRHREPVLRAAKEALALERAGPLMEEGRQVEITESICDLLADTNLVPLSHVKSLRRFDEEESERYAEAIFGLLHGSGNFDDRFEEYLTALEDLLGGRPSWRISTALLALIYPQEHVAVRRSAFLRQAGTIAPTGTYTRKPKAASYRSYRRVAVGVRKRLESMDHEPADLLDVHDFIWTTLRKSALDHL
jgi:hypothetical protein